MSDRLEITFAPLNADPETVTVVLAGDGLALGTKARELESKSAGAVSKAAAAADYKGKYKSTIEILAPAKLGIDRLLVAGLGKTSTLTPPATSAPSSSQQTSRKARYCVTTTSKSISRRSRAMMVRQIRTA